MISQNSSSPLFVVVGATGTQGRSVIKAIEESTKSYRVRAITRDTSSAVAQALEDIRCETFKAAVDDVQSLKAALEGATYAFFMTVNDYADLTPEFAHFRSQGPCRGVRSYPPLPSGKALRILDVQPGVYLANYLVVNPPRPSPDDANTFVFSLALNPDSALPVIDMQEDYGKYVVGPIEWALEGPEARWDEVETIHAAPEYITAEEMAQAFAKVSGKKVTFSILPDEYLYAFMKSILGDRAAGSLTDMHKAIREVGFFGGNALGNAHLPRPARAFQQGLEARKDLVQKVFGGAN